MGMKTENIHKDCEVLGKFINIFSFFSMFCNLTLA